MHRCVHLAEVPPQHRHRLVNCRGGNDALRYPFGRVKELLGPRVDTTIRARRRDQVDDDDVSRFVVVNTSLTHLTREF